MSESMDLDRFSEIFLKQFLTLLEKKKLRIKFDPTFYTNLVKNFGEEGPEETGGAKTTAKSRKASNRAKRGKKSSRNAPLKKKKSADITMIPMLYNRREFILKQSQKSFSGYKFDEIKDLNLADERLTKELFDLVGVDSKQAFELFGEGKQSKSSRSFMD